MSREEELREPSPRLPQALSTAGRGAEPATPSAEEAEGWAALAQLLSAVDEPLDEAALIDGVRGRIERRRRGVRRRAVALASAALVVFLVAGLGTSWRPRPGELAKVEPGAAEAPANGAPAPDAPESGAPAGFVDPAERAGGEAPSDESMEWADDLDVAVATLADDAQAMERRWRNPPDEIARLQEGVDRLLQELSESGL